ncbi:hypothetical protein [Micromonospora aurantiaca (nom. illeg.)]|uniref:hypothetical protein n=1 Tax=Micromonospora aurantiaca (nom. illeg.) TaxID=47850 RepID=UPI00380B720F
MLDEIEQGPLRMGRNLHVEAGRRGDRDTEGGRPFVDEPQMIGERQRLVHVGFLPVRPATGQRFSQPGCQD